jgi:hypothetical protein
MAQFGPGCMQMSLGVPGRGSVNDPNEGREIDRTVGLQSQPHRVSEFDGSQCRGRHGVMVGPASHSRPPKSGRKFTNRQMPW